ncbi:putative ankyrin repeat and SAM domain-containing protein 6 [Rosellinia necatrix]|uniref:Putative ankyrin repeat and SAM domain-containing protein 6 n=1 Tax=Rosellinia necatrix TaxID=77044 RepID=A0A1W2TCY8_ROSNE|nr:putative ankyrin repeat and SAM domain-containing protein 6 [Rosellinia necatrix]
MSLEYHDRQDFKYRQLDLSKSAFRLVRLLAGSTFVECELVHTIIGEAGIPYEAVSYTWGESDKPRRIHLDGRSFAVTLNLHKILCNLRDKSRDRYLWVDAIAINQNDLLEQGHQVQRMKSIYSYAERVLFCLGETSIEITALMGSLLLFQGYVTSHHWRLADLRWEDGWKKAREKSQKENQIADNPYTDTILRDGLQQLLKRPWFRRAWILQEVGNARKASVYCGRDSVDARIFAMSPELLGVDLDSYTAAVFELMPTYLGTALRTPRAGALFPMLVDFHLAEASRPRDKIFALLGLCADQDAGRKIVPDYTHDDSKVICATIKSVYQGRDPLPQPKYCHFPPINQFIDHLVFASVGELPVYIEYFLRCMLKSGNIQSVRPYLERVIGRVPMVPTFSLARASSGSPEMEMRHLLMQHIEVFHHPFPYISALAKVARTTDNCSGMLRAIEELGMKREAIYLPLALTSITYLKEIISTQGSELSGRKRDLLQFQFVLEHSLQIRRTHVSTDPHASQFDGSRELALLSMAVAFGASEVALFILELEHQDSYAYSKRVADALYLCICHRNPPLFQKFLDIVLDQTAREGTLNSIYSIVFQHLMYLALHRDEAEVVYLLCLCLDKLLCEHAMSSEVEKLKHIPFLESLLKGGVYSDRDFVDRNRKALEVARNENDLWVRDLACQLRRIED